MPGLFDDLSGDMPEVVAGWEGPNPAGAMPAAPAARPDALSGTQWLGLALEGFASGAAGRAPQGAAILERGRAAAQQKEQQDRQFKLQEEAIAQHKFENFPKNVKAISELRDILTDEQKKQAGPGLAEWFDNASGFKLGPAFTDGLLNNPGKAEGLVELYEFLKGLPKPFLNKLAAAIEKNPERTDKILEPFAAQAAQAQIKSGVEVSLGLRMYLSEDTRAQLKLPLSSAEKTRQEALAKLDVNGPAEEKQGKSINQYDLSTFVATKGKVRPPTIPQDMTVEQGEESLKNIRSVAQQNIGIKLQGLDIQRGNTTLDNETALRREFNTQAKTFTAVRDSYTRVQASAKNPSPAGDLSMIFAYMKMLDPTSVVRESEFRVAETARPLLERAGISWDRVQSVWEGKRLTDGQRKDYLNRASEIYSGQAKSHQQLVAETRRIAASSGLDPDRVTTEKSLLPGGSSGGASQAEIDAAKKRLGIK